MLKVGIVDYINFYPLFAAFKEKAIVPKMEWRLAVPSELNRDLFAGKLDVSLISAAEYLRHQSHYGLLPDFCIGAKEKVLSVCLYVKGGISNLGGKTVGLTTQSASSATLVKVLCHHFWKVSPEFITKSTIEDLQKCDAFLLIGDDCLRNPGFSGYQAIDLAAAWYKETHLPFTFGVLATRNDVLAGQGSEIEELQQALREAYAWALQHPEKIEQLALKRCPIALDRIREYYRALRYHFDEEQQKGLALFAQLVQALPTHLKDHLHHAHVQ